MKKFNRQINIIMTAELEKKINDAYLCYARKCLAEKKPLPRSRNDYLRELLAEAVSK